MDSETFHCPPPMDRGLRNHFLVIIIKGVNQFKPLIQKINQNHHSRRPEWEPEGGDRVNDIINDYGYLYIDLVRNAKYSAVQASISGSMVYLKRALMRYGMGDEMSSHVVDGMQEALHDYLVGYLEIDEL